MTPALAVWIAYPIGGAVLIWCAAKLTRRGS